MYDFFNFQTLVPNAIVAATYGCTEVMFVTNGLLPHKMGSVAKPNPNISWKVKNWIKIDPIQSFWPIYVNIHLISDSRRRNGGAIGTQ